MGTKKNCYIYYETESLKHLYDNSLGASNAVALGIKYEHLSVIALCPGLLDNIIKDELLKSLRRLNIKVTGYINDVLYDISNNAEKPEYLLDSFRIISFSKFGYGLAGNVDYNH